MDSITLKIGSQSQTGRAGSLETPPLKPGPGNWPAREKIVCRKRQFEEGEGPRFAGKAVGQWRINDGHDFNFPDAAVRRKGCWSVASG